MPMANRITSISPHSPRHADLDPANQGSKPESPRFRPWMARSTRAMTRRERLGGDAGVIRMDDATGGAKKALVTLTSYNPAAAGQTTVFQPDVR